MNSHELSDSLCDGCIHVDDDPNCKPCSTCIDWDIDGYLTAKNFDNGR